MIEKKYEIEDVLPSLFHELGHVLLSHQFKVNHNLKELEAELFSLTCCEFLGVDVDDFYVRLYEKRYLQDNVVWRRKPRFDLIEKLAYQVWEVLR